jgi:hypothetical protein
MSDHLVAGLKEWMGKCLGVLVKDESSMTDPKLIAELLKPV